MRPRRKRSVLLASGTSRVQAGAGSMAVRVQREGCGGVDRARGPRARREHGQEPEPGL